MTASLTFDQWQTEGR